MSVETVSLRNESELSISYVELVSRVTDGRGLCAGLDILATTKREDVLASPDTTGPGSYRLAVL